MVRGSNPGRGEIFCSCPDRPLGPPSLLYNGYWVFSGGKERPGCDADPSPLSSAVGHERVQLCLYSPNGTYSLYRASVPVQGWPLPLHIRQMNKTINTLPSDTQSGTTAVGDQAPFSSQLNVFTGSPSVNLQKHNVLCVTWAIMLHTCHTQLTW
jgi:hypothetical protein